MCISKQPKKSPIILATFVWKFVIKKFQKSHPIWSHWWFESYLQHWEIHPLAKIITLKVVKGPVQICALIFYSNGYDLTWARCYKRLRYSIIIFFAVPFYFAEITTIIRGITTLRKMSQRVVLTFQICSKIWASNQKP